MENLPNANPLIAEKMRLDNEVASLRMLQSSYLNERESFNRQLKSQLPSAITGVKKLTDSLTQDIERAATNKTPDFSITLEGQTFDERARAGEVFESVTLMHLRSRELTEIGKYQGFKLSVKGSDLNFGSLLVQLEGAGHYDITLDPSTQIGSIHRIENRVNHLPDRLEECKEELI